MGIEGLFKFIEDKYPDAITLIDLSSCSNKKLSVDANLIFQRHWSIQCDKYIKSIAIDYQCDIRSQINKDIIFTNTMRSVLWFLIKLLKYKITPILVFDGGMHPEKLKTCDKRKKRKDDYKSAVNDLIDKADIFNEKYEESLKYCLSKECHPDEDRRKLCRDILRKLGIPVLLSKFDAEKLCCSLYIEEKVDGVLSEDSDCIPYGGLDFYRLPRKEDGEDKIRHVSVIKLLDLMKIEFEQLVDFCIMCKCDYNERVKGYGPAKVLKEIKANGSIDNLKFDTKCLNHVVCREIFQYELSEDLALEYFEQCDLILQDSDLDDSELENYRSEVNILIQLRNNIIRSN